MTGFPLSQIRLSNYTPKPSAYYDNGMCSGEIHLHVPVRPAYNNPPTHRWPGECVVFRNARMSAEMSILHRYYQGRNHNPYPQPQAFPAQTPPANAYATAPSTYVAPNTLPVAAQHAIPQSSYSGGLFAVTPAFPVSTYPTPPPYVVVTPSYPTPARTYPTAAPTTTTTTTTTTTPAPPKCFLNSHGFRCCNKALDLFLDQAIFQLQTAHHGGCNLQKFATDLQKDAHRIFGHSMESIVASGQMENLAHYAGDLYCKRKTTDGKTVVLYGSAVPYVLDEGVNRPMNESELTAANYPDEWTEIGVHDGHEENIS
ncbi:unnamed protein product [Caenorhabditis sp. 36 PRJEB53466]|nr:unnamed protein product [Caenorhabditis sp. 36 PRJEB53466]